MWVRTHFIDSVAIARARARGAQRPPPRSGAFRKFWARREPMGEISVSGMALGLSTGKTKVVALAEKRTEPAGIMRIMTLLPSITVL